MKLSDPKFWLALVSLVIVIVVVNMESERTSPGPLTTVHSAQERLSGPEGCAACHGDGATSMAAACASCHDDIANQIASRTGFHGTREGVDVNACATCHVEHHGDAVALVDARAFELAGVADVTHFEHDFASFRLSGKHDALACEGCHANAKTEHLSAGNKRFLGLSQECGTCHDDPHEGRFAARCDECHGQAQPFADLANFVHSDALPLLGAHAGHDCKKCHEPGSDRSVEALGSAEVKPPERACVDCHASPHAPTFLASVAREVRVEPGASCSKCHSALASSFDGSAATMPLELHAASGFALDAAHVSVKCEACHGAYGESRAFAERYPGRSATDCAACHSDPHGGQFLDASGQQPSCVSCHARETFKPHLFDVASHARTRFPLDGAHVRTDCEQCHAPAAGSPRVFRGTPTRCEECHRDAHANLFATPVGELALRDDSRGSCSICHDTTRFADTGGRFGTAEHGLCTGFDLLGAHARAACETCHARSERPDALGRRFGRVADLFGAAVTECATCHRDVHRGAFDAERFPRVVDGRATCARCHSQERFREMPHGFDHGTWTSFELEGAHANAECAACHGTTEDAKTAGRTLGWIAERWTGAPSSCASCHEDPHAGRFDAEHLPATVDGARDCARCHDTDSFRGEKPRAFDHGVWTGVALEGRHAEIACEACHVPPRDQDRSARRLGQVVGSRCGDCHADPHVGQFEERSCESCHTSTHSFAQTKFDHRRDARFALDERHAHLACATCHKPWPLENGRFAVRYKPLGLTCVECHGFEKRGDE